MNMLNREDATLNRNWSRNVPNSEKKQRVIPLGPGFKTPPYFVENQEGIFNTFF